MWRCLSVLNRWMIRINRFNWASLTIIVTLWTIFFTYEHARLTSDIVAYENKRALLKALQLELEFMTPWTSPTYDDLPLKVYQSQNQHFSWYDPSYRLLSFGHPSLQGLLNNPVFLQVDETLIDSLMGLNQVLRSLYENEDESSKFKFAFPDLYEQAIIKVNELRQKFPRVDQDPDAKYYEALFSSGLDPRLRNYLNIIYAQNYDLCVHGIGGTAGIHARWVQSGDLLQREKAKIVAPKAWRYFLPLLLLIGFFIIPSGWSYIGRRFHGLNVVPSPVMNAPDVQQQVRHQPVWTEERERRQQVVEGMYDRARGIGVDILKVFLNTAIVIAGVPIVFYEKIKQTFGEQQMLWIHRSWFLILISLIAGFISYLTIFEGYYQHAHSEGARLLSNRSDDVQAFEHRSNLVFDIGHWVGLLGAACFISSLACVVVAIGVK